jgi:holin-like protein
MAASIARSSAPSSAKTHAAYSVQGGSIVQSPGAKAALGLVALAGLCLGGDLVASMWRLPIPGPVLAGVALVVWLGRRPGDAAAFVHGDRLIAALPLLFLPLVIGALASLRFLGPALAPFLITMVVSTLAALVATVAAARVTAWLCSRSR